MRWEVVQEPQDKEVPPVRPAREAGGYPWTHLLKPPLEGEITAEDILRETTPRRSMSREFSRSRTRSPVDENGQKILNLDSSPGSSRRHGEEGADEGIHVPNFSKEISLDSEEEIIKNAVDSYIANPPKESEPRPHLLAPIEIPKNVSPKSILKRRGNEHQHMGVTESREKTKCCHPLVNKIKHLADKTLQKLERTDTEKSPQSKRKKNESDQEIRQLKSSPGAVKRQKFSAIKLGDSDEMSKNMSVETLTPPRKKREHIYEDIEESKKQEERTLHFSSDVEDRTMDQITPNDIAPNREGDNVSEKKSISSQDPSLITDDVEIKADEHIMEMLHSNLPHDNVNKEAVLLDDDIDVDEPNVDEIFQNQLEESRQMGYSPNITITDITDETVDPDAEHILTPCIESSPSPQLQIKNEHVIEDVSGDWSKTSRWTSEGGTPAEKPLRPTREGSVRAYTPDVRCGCQFFQSDSLLPERHNPVGTRPTSRTSYMITNERDHEYEIIGKPSTNISYNAQRTDKITKQRTDDELSSTTSLERKFLQHTSDEEDITMEDKEINETDILSAEALQKNIEDRFFVDTPSSVSRTECDVSTSQVDSSALENLPLKRDSRSKNEEGIDSKIQKRIKEGTGKLKSQAGKLRTKLQSIKTKQFTMPEKPRFSLPERAKFKMPERPKLSFPDRPKFSMPDRRKFSLPDRPKFKKINISEKLTLGDRKKFSFPDRPKITVPDLSKFKLPESFSSFTRKKEDKVESMPAESTSDIRDHTASVEFEAKTFPRIFSRKKKPIPVVSSSPDLNREDSPQPVFIFTRVKKSSKQQPLPRPSSPEEPREYGAVIDQHTETNDYGKQYETTYDFDKPIEDYQGDVEDQYHDRHDASSSEILKESPINQEHMHVINEIDNDEFFVRPRGISRENIQVREYLSDEIRQAFKIPKNTLAMMGSASAKNDERLHAHDVEGDPELLLDENEPMSYSQEDLNEKDDGYYTFPPVRPSRAKKKKSYDLDSVKYIDESVNASIQFSEVDLALPEYTENVNKTKNNDMNEPDNANNMQIDNTYTNETFFEFNDNLPIQSQTLPMPPRRKKKVKENEYLHSSYDDFRDLKEEGWNGLNKSTEDIIVYRTEHEYFVPQTDQITEDKAIEQSPLPPRRSRNRSRSSHGTSLCDDDRTSHGAESLTLDTQIPTTGDMEIERKTRQESPGYATIDKTNYPPSKGVRRSKSKTPPARRRKSNSSERKYYTVGPSRHSLPDRPPRKKSSTSLVTLDSLTKRSSGDITQYVEIDETPLDDIHKELISGEVVSKMKDRPLPPPPRPPRDTNRRKKCNGESDKQLELDLNINASSQHNIAENVVEIEVSTQTDPLPDDVDYELGMDENDLSMSSSLKELIDEEHMTKSLSKLTESPRGSRPVSRSEKSLRFSDPKISDLSKATLGRTSPTVILVERRVSSPTRINESDTMLTEASLTVQHIDVDESKIADLPPLPTPRSLPSTSHSKKKPQGISEDRCLERVSTEVSRDVLLDNLVTQRLQVTDLDVGRLNVSELQASKILVSDIEGMSLQVTELDSKSGHISVSGIEFSQSVIDEIVKKFTELSANTRPRHESDSGDHIRPLSREEETQTDQERVDENITRNSETARSEPPRSDEDQIAPPQRPPPPDLTPLLYSYLHEMATPPSSLYNLRAQRDRPFTDFHESQHHTPPAPSRRLRRRNAPQNESTSDEDKPRPSPRRMPPPVRTQEPSVTEAGALFLRACHSSVSRSLRNIFNLFMSYISGTEDKRDIQMALVIFLVLIAGLIMFGLSDSRTVHHHHWEFFNPPNGKP